jgi:hypothetical protein
MRAGESGIISPYIAKCEIIIERIFYYARFRNMQVYAEKGAKTA